MAQKRWKCTDCGEPFDDWRNFAANNHPDWDGYRYCGTCAENYERCSICGELRHLRDMRQAYCVDCRRAYDRDRWARQRAAWGVS